MYCVNDDNNNDNGNNLDVLQPIKEGSNKIYSHTTRVVN